MVIYNKYKGLDSILVVDISQETVPLLVYITKMLFLNTIIIL